MSAIDGRRATDEKPSFPFVPSPASGSITTGCLSPSIVSFFSGARVFSSPFGTHRFPISASFSLTLRLPAPTPDSRLLDSRLGLILAVSSIEASRSPIFKVSPSFADVLSIPLFQRLLQRLPFRFPVQRSLHPYPHNSSISSAIEAMSLRW